jgi:hypothetical protein
MNQLRSFKKSNKKNIKMVIAMVITMLNTKVKISKEWKIERMKDNKIIIKSNRSILIFRIKHLKLKSNLK